VAQTDFPRYRSGGAGGDREGGLQDDFFGVPWTLHSGTIGGAFENRCEELAMAENTVGFLVRRLRTLAAGPAEGQADLELLERFVQQQDEGAFAGLLERHGPMVLGVCRRALHDEHLAEDVFQATFLVLARNAAAIRKPSSLAGWLHGVALRLARKAADEAARAARSDSRPLTEPPGPAAEASWREVRRILDEELQRLPENYRLPLVLCYLEGRTRDEAADELGCTPGRIKGLLERGRERLRGALIRRGLAPAAAGAALMTETVLAAPVSPLLAVAGRIAVRLLAGESPAACGVSSAVARLSEGGLPLMASKKLVLLLALVIGAAGLSAGLLAQRPGSSDNPPRAWEKSVPPTGHAEKEKAREDNKAAVPADARAIVAKGIRVLGGAELLARASAVHTRFKEKTRAPAKGDKGPETKSTYETTYEIESFVQPGRRKTVVTVRPGMRTMDVIDGEKSWQVDNVGQFHEDTGESLEFRKQSSSSAYADRILRLLPLLEDKSFTLAAVGEDKVSGRAARKLKVSSTGKPDVLLFFDKQTGFLVKYAVRVPAPSLKSDVLEEIVFSDYREIDPAAPDEKMVKAAGLGTEVAALLKFLRGQAPDPKRKEKIKSLIRRLGDDRFAVRRKSVEELVAIGQPAAPLLIEAAADKDAEVARLAKDALSHIRRQGGRETIAAAVRLIALKRPPQAAEVLLAYLPDADSSTAREIQAALAVLAEKDTKPPAALVKALDDKDPLRRQAAAAALGRDGGRSLKQPGRRLFLEGVKMPMKTSTYRNGKLEGESEIIEVLEVGYYNRFEDKVFARPR
jgi:RNA polymerase sigma factor (sigma-70 family)